MGIVFFFNLDSQRAMKLAITAYFWTTKPGSAYKVLCTRRYWTPKVGRYVMAHVYKTRESNTPETSSVVVDTNLKGNSESLMRNHNFVTQFSSTNIHV